MKNISILILVLSLFSVACTTNKPTEKHHHDKSEEVQLNDGNRWKANTETTSGIKKMQLLLNDFSDKESTEAFTELEENLKVEFTNIFSKCTMTGESHNQLHTFLKPMLKYFDGLNSGDLKVCQKNYTVLKEHLKEYSKYFE